MQGRLAKMIGLGIKQFRDPYYQGFAAQMSFFYMLSIVPLALIMSQVLFSIFQTDVEEAVGFIMQALGGELSNNLMTLLSYRSAGAVNVVYVAIALWAASRGQFCLARICNFMLSEGRTTGHGYWRERIRSLVTSLLMIVSVVLVVVVMIYGGRIVEVFFTAEQVWLYARWPIAFGLFFLVLSITYRILPSEPIRYKDVIPGSFFAAIGIVLVTLGYARYIRTVAKYDIIYGALANIVALMFWFYFLAWVICLGMLLNKVVRDTKDGGGHPEVYWQ